MDDSTNPTPETPRPDTPADAAAAGQPGPGAPLNGNDAVNLAAEQAQQTAGRNIPGLGDLPVPDDTANLRQGPSLHDGLLALLPLIGVWRGEGQADTATDGQYNFGQQLTFAHDGENYISYESRIWKLDDQGAPAGADQRETGFLRISEKDEIELICCHSTGVVEILYGEPITERAWQLESASTMVTATGPSTLGPGKRLYGLLPNNDLGWVDERLVDGALHPRMSAQLKRFMG
ncbi:FABP family protein [Corynebacterium sp. CCM 9185]|uniref:Ferric nitrobindin-like protein n=1 Tax=Corynebacterium marambiense TaxID=2765364 RepID=A0ABS0VWH1_9CORY|nr:FABP family protein [Corynebacterium marambiense]MBI9001124.1 FABP family protein [Corynebacterium marambiense]MCK7664365.1 FABP family protein [Corynebacterium marambiense]MCX7543178.1 FABP family protein [Corynebacterium marambiense]